MLEKERIRRNPPGSNNSKNDPLDKVFNRTNRQELSWAQTGFRNDPFNRRKGYILAMWSWIASTIDLLVLISVSCLFTMVFSWITQSSLKTIITQIQLTNIYEFLAIIFVITAWVYLIALRVLVGHTIGEWACQLRLGQPSERNTLGYFFKVFFRTTLIMSTGLISLPLLSLTLGEDIPGAICDLRLFSLK